MTIQDILHTPTQILFKENQFLEDFCAAHNITSSMQSLSQHLEQQNLLDTTSKEEFIQTLQHFISEIDTIKSTQKIESLTVYPGIDKSGQSETCTLELNPGEITCIVGPTGSGKSRLLADIEWLANKDTPTQRTVLLNKQIPDDNFKKSFGGRLIAQITQNMNFILDMNVKEFLHMHTQSHFIPNPEEVVTEVIDLANQLSGEAFSPNTPVTFLSGGQSRALMIADVACIGRSPIVLIDEIENAGVDKKKALELLIQQDKIVLMATHDPLLILQANKRVVIKNGGMSQIITTNHFEESYYKQLVEADEIMQKARNYFRKGNRMSKPTL